jgi:hypothetical protein
MFSVSKIAGIVVAVFLVAAASGYTASAQPQSAPRTPVLVELFTSEGCSDCPPADALLGALDAQQFVTGAQVIVLSEHVTYWNHEGWRDPFSFSQMDDRQQEYAREFGLTDVYTPEAVVDGAVQFVGNDVAKMRNAITHATATPKVNLSIESTHQAANGAIDFSVRADSPHTVLVAAIAEDATSSQVSRGENAGRTLHHVAVVRVLKEFGKGRTDGQTLELSGANLIAAEKTGTPLRLVVFLINSGNGHVVGAAEQVLNLSSAANAGLTAE